MAASPDDVMAMVFFARVVEQRSFTAAAAKLGVSKSVVSARVAAFERRLRAPLLHRTTRKLSLTREGLALYERCARVAAAADEAAAAADRTGDTPHGAAARRRAHRLRPGRLAAPMAKLPRASSAGPRRADHERSDHRSRRGRRRRRDPHHLAAGRRGPGGAQARHRSHRAVRVARLPGAQGNAGGAGGPRASRLPAVFAAEGGRRVALPRPEQAQSFSVPIEGRFSAASGAVLRGAALAGMGLAVLPRFMVAADLDAGRLRPVLDSFAGVGAGDLRRVSPAPGRAAVPQGARLRGPAGGRTSAPHPTAGRADHRDRATAPRCP